MSKPIYAERKITLQSIEVERDENIALYVEKYYDEATAFLDKAIEAIIHAGAWKGVTLKLPNDSEEFWKALQAINESSEDYQLNFHRGLIFKGQIKVKSLEEQDWN